MHAQCWFRVNSVLPHFFIIVSGAQQNGNDINDAKQDGNDINIVIICTVLGSLLVCSVAANILLSLIIIYCCRKAKRKVRGIHSLIHISGSLSTGISNLAWVWSCLHQCSSREPSVIECFPSCLPMQGQASESTTVDGVACVSA